MEFSRHQKLRSPPAIAGSLRQKSSSCALANNRSILSHPARVIKCRRRRVIRRLAAPSDRRHEQRGSKADISGGLYFVIIRLIRRLDGRAEQMVGRVGLGKKEPEEESMTSQSFDV